MDRSAFPHILKSIPTGQVTLRVCLLIKEAGHNCPNYSEKQKEHDCPWGEKQKTCSNLKS